MKYLIVLSACCLLVYANGMLGVRESVLMQCLEKNNMSQEQYEEIQQNMDWEKLYCTQACIFEQKNALFQNGKLNEAVLQAEVKEERRRMGQEYKDQMKNLITTCVTKANEMQTTNKCEPSGVYYKCYNAFEKEYL